jgi:hypothetical protein
MFRERDSKHKVINNQSLWIDMLDQCSLGLVKIKVGLKDKGRRPKANCFT